MTVKLSISDIDFSSKGEVGKGYRESTLDGLVVCKGRFFKASVTRIECNVYRNDFDDTRKIDKQAILDDINQQIADYPSS